jgi:hypothetical protein
VDTKMRKSRKTEMNKKNKKSAILRRREEEADKKLAA